MHLILKTTVALLLLSSLVACGGSAQTYTLLGEVMVMEEEGITITDQGGCVGTGNTPHIRSGETLTITMANGDAIETKLDTGKITPEGNCSLEFVVDVPDSDTYAFTYGDETTVRDKRTVGTDIPPGFWHSRAADGDWWITISFADQ